MVRPSQRTSKPPVLKKQSSSRLSSAGMFASAFHSSNRPSLFVGVLMGMSVMAILTRLRESANDLGSLTDLMVSPNTNNGAAESSTSWTTKSVSIRKPKRQHPQFDPNWDIFQRIEAEQTGRVISPNTKIETGDRPVRFVNWQQLSEQDVFSASWLQKRETFLSMNLEGMGICEDASFFAFRRDAREEYLRMTMDYLDFAVEHLSKWYTMMNIMINDIPLNNAIQKLEDYMGRGRDYPVDPLFQETLAAIAFMPFKDEARAEKAKRISVTTLAATIESLRRAGFGRVVVCGMETSDQDIAEEAFQLISRSIRDDKESGKVGHMEVQFVRGHKGHATTQYHSLNIPRSTLMGLREAFRIQERGDRDVDSIANMKNWIGDHSLNHWKYIYLTEPDSILATRPSTLKTLKRYVEGGTVLVPWRLQPIPHESDVRGCKNRDLFIKEAGDFQQVLELDALDANPDRCCDEFKGPEWKPWLQVNQTCDDNFWYMCGFTMPVKPMDDEHGHDRLKPYKLIRLKHGTQITHLASQEHGRRCRPMKSEKDDFCEPSENK